MPLPLRLGDSGDEVRDLNRRLSALGYDTGSAAKRAEFDQATFEAVRSFQQRRGIDASGCCDELTWNTLVEAGHALGDRSLYHTRPMLRGDDVAALQLRLGSLGFDAGRADGIFGPQTEAAVAEFQRNAGLTSDGVAGHQTITELVRLSARADTTRPVAQVRQYEVLRTQSRELRDTRVCIGQIGPLPALVHSVARQLRERGAVVIEEHQSDWSAHARTANDFASALYIGITPCDTDMCSISYFATEGFVSVGGQRLAQLCAARLAPALGLDRAATQGMRLPILRETRMPAILVEIGSPSRVVTRTSAVAFSLVDALARWVLEPVS